MLELHFDREMLRLSMAGPPRTPSLAWRTAVKQIRAVRSVVRAGTYGSISKLDQIAARERHVFG